MILQVFRQAEALTESVFSGVNETLFAYGQCLRWVDQTENGKDKLG